MHLKGMYVCMCTSKSELAPCQLVVCFKRLRVELVEFFPELLGCLWPFEFKSMQMH